MIFLGLHLNFRQKEKKKTSIAVVDKKDKKFRRVWHLKNKKRDSISLGRILNQFSPPPPSPPPPRLPIFNYLQDKFLEDDRDRLAMACSMKDRYKGLGGDAVARLWAATVLERQW